MTGYILQFSSAADQAELVTKLRNAGIAVIQISNGLCVKTDLSAADLKAMTGIEPAPVSAATGGKLSKDVRKFLSENDSTS